MAIEWQAARFLTQVAEALSRLEGQTEYGEFYVSEAQIGFDGEDTHLRVIPNEHGGYDIAEVHPNLDARPDDQQHSD